MKTYMLFNIEHITLRAFAVHFRISTETALWLQWHDFIEGIIEHEGERYVPVEMIACLRDPIGYGWLMPGESA